MNELWAGAGTLVGIALGTLVGLPVAPLYLAAGLLWGVWALPLVAVALVVHMVLSYALTKSFLRPTIARLTKKLWQKKKLPSLSNLGPQRLTVLVRLIPGLPLFMQSYFLCLLNVPFAAYFGWSLFIQLLWAGGFVLAGGALVRGQWGLLASVSLLIILFILLSQRYAQPQRQR